MNARYAALSLAMLAGLAASGCSGTSGSREPASSEYMHTYLVSISETIANNIRFPEEALAARLEGIATIVMTVERDGRVADVFVETSSGVDAYDAESLAAVRRSSPLPRFPDRSDDKRLQLRLPMAFTICPSTLPVNFEVAAYSVKCPN